MPTDKLDISNIKPELETIKFNGNIVDIDVLDTVINHVGGHLSKINPATINWNDFKSFWPPRLISGFKQDKCSCFFGAGLSIPSKLPNWNNLLNKYLNIDENYTNDSDLKYDPLTLAEIARNHIGTDALQNILRTEYSKPVKPSTSHYMVASLRCQIYITTNYDTLFEDAWEEINPNIDLITITNDLDVQNNFDANHIGNPDEDKAYLFKIHGSIERRNEKLILTRTDYRNHYRSNILLFDTFKSILSKHHILFIGFSHNDADISRIVEDAIHEYEVGVIHNHNLPQPNFYTLQFDMANHTPEVFAAKGIVALEPPITSFSDDYRSKGLNVALAEFLFASHYNLDVNVSLESELDSFKSSIESALEYGINKLEQSSSDALNSINTSANYGWMTNLVTDLDQLCSEGLFLCDHQGRIKEYETPPHYNKPDRNISFAVANRPYFRQSKTFRKPFVSDAVESQFNNNSTIFLCLPLVESSKFKGLLFSAFQLGKWELPKNEAKNLWNNQFSAILIDNNGICLLPPNNEIDHDNFGYNHERMFSISIRDKLITRLNENVVPINKDDEVVGFSPNYKVYCLISQLINSNWKIGIAKSIFLNK